MAKTYEELLDNALKTLPKDVTSTSRFETPRAKGHIQGNRTIISNFHQIAHVLRRDPEHLLKYVLRELATPGELRKNELILGTRVSASHVNKKIEQYTQEFVLCRECRRPDTKLVKEDRFLFVSCMACGARHPVKSKI